MQLMELYTDLQKQRQSAESCEPGKSCEDTAWRGFCTVLEAPVDELELHTLLLGALTHSRWAMPGCLEGPAARGWGSPPCTFVSIFRGLSRVGLGHRRFSL